MKSEQVVTGHNTGTTAQSATVETVTHVDGRALEQFEQLRVRLKTSQLLTGTGGTPTLDVYLQRAVAADPAAATAEDWEDFYHFPQITATPADQVVSLPLPLPQDTDGSLGTASRAQAVETLAADTLLAGHWMGPIRIREVIGAGGASSIDQAAIYDIEIVGR